MVNNWKKLYKKGMRGKTLNMKKNEDSGSPSWGASFFMQTTEDVARAVAAARSPQPTMVFSLKDDNGNSPLQKLQHHVSRVLKGFSQTPEVQNGTYNPESDAIFALKFVPILLTSHIFITYCSFEFAKLTWIIYRPLKEQSRLFESFVVVELHPNCDIQALQKQYFGRKSEKVRVNFDVVSIRVKLPNSIRLCPEIYHPGQCPAPEKCSKKVDSHRKAAAATASGKFKEEIIPVATMIVDPQIGDEKPVTISVDDGIRPNASLSYLGKLKPAFKKDGTTTAGNSSQVSDGAGAVLLMKRSVAMQKGLPILGVFRCELR
ncbi:hypothetical protein RHSIM_Rhsim05G0033300 [Rhododendron simsii]|uniref:Thiolase N-terminal domain-containing protein n=1 Tax=Rhododendron simsii TaxID=118357 RepID=A0A834GVA6_RHOSS|nr:hypothetical protein RHSIM_Rhsim05G0033300 [Rhododendron simsii]